jgi:hypothetical protein
VTVTIRDSNAPVEFWSEDYQHGINTAMVPSDLEYPWTYTDMDSGSFWLLHIPTPVSLGWGLRGERLESGDWTVVELKRRTLDRSAHDQ